MNLKTFAQEGRRRLMAGVGRRLDYWGFDSQGQVTDAPVAVSGGFTHRGQIHDDPRALELWSALKKAVEKRGRDVVIEEAAYTWFNRVMAMRILSRGGYDEPQLDLDANASSLEPLMLRRARQGHAPFLSDEDRTRLNKVVSDYSKEQEALALLLTGYCRQHGTLSEVFGRPDDFTELLLPDDMLKSGGFLDLLQDAEQDADALTAEQYGKVELIGWLYQYYISEKKDEVFDTFKKGKKAEAKDIPAATQIFTPNWIVKYMVENTAGKAWLDKHPTSPLKGQMTYLVENEADGTRQPIIDRVEDLTLIDPACGSGHILVEGFDLIYQMYQEEFASPTEAVKSILEHNLFGLDIDERAAQLSTFAVLLKAAQYDRDVWDRGYRPHVYAMPHKRHFDATEVKTFLGDQGKEYANELEIALSKMQDAKNLGAVMKLSLSDPAHAFITARQRELDGAHLDLFEEATIQDMTPFIRVLLTMTRRYTAVVANPPYMGSRNMNAGLKSYLQSNYIISKSDLYSVFIEIADSLTQNAGRYSLITLPTWMFIGAFKSMREWLIKDRSIDSLLHMGRGVFGVDYGSSTFTIRKEFNEFGCEFFRLHKRKIQLIDSDDIASIFLGAQKNSIAKYDFDSYEKGDVHSSFGGGERLRFNDVNQIDFAEIPGAPLAYWADEKVFGSFRRLPPFSHFANAKVGMQTGDNERYLRCWFEVDPDMIDAPGHKWLTYLKGGAFRKWFGNLEYVLFFDGDGESILSGKNGSVMSLASLSDSKCTWSSVSAGGFHCRVAPSHSFHDITGHCFYPEEESKWQLLAWVNSCVFDYFIQLINPTLSFQVGDVRMIPTDRGIIASQFLKKAAMEAVSLVENDSASREIFKGFSGSSLCRGISLSQGVLKWEESSQASFFRLLEIEQAINEAIIQLYGFEGLLQSEVKLKQISLLQEELDGDDLEALEDEFRAGGGQPIELPIKRDVVMQQFLSYCVGLMMGRYRLDVPGLHIAHPEPTAEEVASYSYNGHTVEIDDDAILPLMGSACQFPDDVLHRVYGLLDVIWGEETRISNVNFLEECLGKSLEKYLVKDFFKDHCKHYKKKPIYWLFASKKGAFQVLVYMHRMNAFTVQKIRDRYLLDHLRQLRSEIERLEGLGVNASKAELKKLEKLRKEELECREYELVLKDVADQQIAFDLDDGVTENHKLFGEVVAKIK